MPLDMSNPGAVRGLVGSRSALWLVRVIYVVCGLAFVNDLWRSDTLAYGIVYVPLVATALLHRQRWGLRVVTMVASLLVVIGAFFPVVNPDLPDLIGNRVLSIVAILATAAFVHHARTRQDRLAAETRRAERAEQIKAEVLRNLSQEMRTPLQTLLGVLSLMMVECRPDQKQALGRVQSGGKQLLSTMDNLVDLTQIDERPLRRQPVDIASILRDAADSAGSVAAEAGVTIVLKGESQETDAVGDAWATRRILDNLIANAVKFTPPGGTVSLAVNQASDQVTASVSDTGRGLPPGLARSLQPDLATPDDDALLPGPNGVGLTLSDHLAKAMNGSLLLESPPGMGARVSLRLPAAMKG